LFKVTFIILRDAKSKNISVVLDTIYLINCICNKPVHY